MGKSFENCWTISWWKLNDRGKNKSTILRLKWQYICCAVCNINNFPHVFFFSFSPFIGVPLPFTGNKGHYFTSIDVDHKLIYHLFAVYLLGATCAINKSQPIRAIPFWEAMLYIVFDILFDEGIQLRSLTHPVTIVLNMEYMSSAIKHNSTFSANVAFWASRCSKPLAEKYIISEENCTRNQCGVLNIVFTF